MFRPQRVTGLLRRPVWTLLRAAASCQDVSLIAPTLVVEISGLPPIADNRVSLFGVAMSQLDDGSVAVRALQFFAHCALVSEESRVY
jgi:hypothetical protein